MDIEKITESLKNCPCGRRHTLHDIRVEIFEGALQQTAVLLKESGFSEDIHLVADLNTLQAADGILELLKSGGFNVTSTIFGNLTLCDMDSVALVREQAKNAKAIISVGTGSLNDVCRYACFLDKKPLCIFATAPSMDGFASQMAPVTENGFKRTYQAIAPRLIIADSRILADSPDELKAAGLGDLLGKYTALADWKIAALLTGEYYCKNIEDLTKSAVDRAVKLADTAKTHDIAYAEALMEALILSGLAMYLSGCTRPASGAEHHLSHFLEMLYAENGLPPMYHGKKVGVACGIVADIYHRIAKLDRVSLHPHIFPEKPLKELFGRLYPELKKENTPDPILKVSPSSVLKNWEEIRSIMSEVPTGDFIKDVLRKAKGAGSYKEAGIPEDMARAAARYGFYARFRLTGMRLCSIITLTPDIFEI